MNTPSSLTGKGKNYQFSHPTFYKLSLLILRVTEVTLVDTLVINTCKNPEVGTTSPHFNWKKLKVN